MNIYDLKCMNTQFPINVTDELFFSWKLKNCSMQKGYILKIFDEENIVYISDFVESNQCAFIYANFNKVSLKLYSWQVEVTTDCFTVISEINYFRVGLLTGFSSCAKWISSNSRYVADVEYVGSRAIYLQKKIEITELSSTSIINICGLGLYELYLNHQKVGSQVLDSAFTAYDKRCLYATFDVTNYLKLGENTIHVILGDGWYNQTTHDTWGFFRASWRDFPKLLFQLNVGKRQIVSDKSWEVGFGAIVSNAIRAGEIWDSRIESVVYTSATQVAAPGGILVPQTISPIRECEFLSPMSIETNDDGILYDFGKNITGYCKIDVIGNKDSTISLTYSERLTNGKIDNETNSMYIMNKNLRYQTDEIICNGEMICFKPKFVYHGFRYVQVNSSDASCKIKKIIACFIHTELEKIGNFQTSDEILHQLYEMSIHSILSNFHGFPTDCPHREKNGWTGDAQLSLETSIYNFDMLFAYRKWLDDIVDTQRESGQIAAIAPTSNWGYNWGSGPAWDIALFRIPYALYCFYDDVETAKKMYPKMCKYHEYASSYLENGLLSFGLGDWNYPYKIEFEKCPTELTDSCYFLLMTKILKNFALLFEKNKIEYLDKIIFKVENAIREKYANKEESMTGLACLCYFEISDESEKLIQLIKQNEYTFLAGILGVKFILTVLGKCSRTDIAYRMLTKLDYPSFGYWIKNGATSLCENFEMTYSLNHHMFSDISEFMMNYICGIRFEKGMKSIIFEPNIPDQMNDAQALIKTSYGIVSIKIKRRGDKIFYNFEVPPCCTAYLIVKDKKQFFSAGIHHVVL